MISSDEYLERIVAGIHSVTTTDADVKWNEFINNRQFDVVIRFSIGILNYLVVIEVKNKTRKSSVSDIEAFITKSRDQNASKMVFVTAAGFQSGAIAVATRHGVDLFTVTFDYKSPMLPDNANYFVTTPKGVPSALQPILTFRDRTLVAIVDQITLLYVDGKKYEVPNEQSQMTYYCRKTKFSDGSSLHNLIERIDLSDLRAEKTISSEVRFDIARKILPPDEHFLPEGRVIGLKYAISGSINQVIGVNMMVEPGSFIYPTVYENVITGESTTFFVNQLPLGDRRVKTGEFYFLPHPLMYYYCDSIEGGMIKWHLIESFQNGELIRATFSQGLNYSPQYIPVSDKKILKRLNSRLHEYLKNKQNFAKPNLYSK